MKLVLYYYITLFHKMQDIFILHRLWSAVYCDEKHEYNDVFARINGIDRFRIDTDGNGVRSLMLMAGCPLNCAYCGNKKYKDIFPETRNLSISDLGFYDGIKKTEFILR